MKANQAAFDVGQLAFDMAQGHGAHSAAMTVVGRLDERTLRRVTEYDPVGTAPTKDGVHWRFNLYDYLMYGLKDSAIVAELPRVWLAGSLLAVGDALARNGYFDHAPELELVRHLRNGIAHGNRFRIDHPDELKKYPAHNRDAWSRKPGRMIFEITGARWNAGPVRLHGSGRRAQSLVRCGRLLEAIGRREVAPPDKEVNSATASYGEGRSLKTAMLG
jgi:hypothetical protein